MTMMIARWDQTWTRRSPGFVRNATVLSRTGRLMMDMYATIAGAFSRKRNRRTSFNLFR